MRRWFPYQTPEINQHKVEVRHCTERDRRSRQDKSGDGKNGAARGRGPIQTVPLGTRPSRAQADTAGLPRPRLASLIELIHDRSDKAARVRAAGWGLCWWSDIPIAE